jgi:colanic acid/amylovoran biosynthesis glycosyltransferase
MRIAYVTSMLPYGSQEAYFIPELRELRATGHDVLVVPMRPRGDGVQSEALEVSTVRRQPLLSAEIALEAARTIAAAPTRTIAAAWPLLLPARPTVWVKNCVALPKALWLANVARQWRADHIHAQWAATTATMAFVASALTGIPWSLTAHRWDIPENNLIARKARTAKFLRAISEKGAAELGALVDPQDRQRITVLHVGIDLPAFRRPTPRAPTRPIQMIEAANLTSLKGHADLIQAVAFLRDRGVAVELDLAGEGEGRQRFELLAAELRVADRVRFLGRVPHHELLRDLSAGRWDLFVLPSLVEGIPVSIAEAMAAGVPVVATPVGGVTELVTPETGVLVPPGDAPALATAIAELIASPTRWPPLVEAARKAVEASFGVRGVIEKLTRRMME